MRVTIFSCILTHKQNAIYASTVSRFRIQLTSTPAFNVNYLRNICIHSKNINIYSPINKFQYLKQINKLFENYKSNQICPVRFHSKRSSFISIRNAGREMKEAFAVVMPFCSPYLAVCCPNVHFQLMTTVPCTHAIFPVNPIVF